jgi:hypothetical protein
MNKSDHIHTESKRWSTVGFGANRQNTIHSEVKKKTQDIQEQYFAINRIDHILPECAMRQQDKQQEIWHQIHHIGIVSK